MSLEPLFSLSPVNPRVYNYDPANPSFPYASATLQAFGGFTRFYSPYTLADQHDDDEIHIGFDPVQESEQTITSAVDDFYRRCGVFLSFAGYNVNTVNQYLLVFRLAKALGSPIAQFFVGTSLVRDEALTQSPYDDIAILLDTPGDGSGVTMFVRLAGPTSSFYQSFFFKGVDCYLL
jgi:hypothetical protein